MPIRSALRRVGALIRELRGRTGASAGGGGCAQANRTLTASSNVDGVKIHYEVFGDGDPTILLLPTWSIIHSRFWKMQVPYLARHYRVVTFDGRGNGRSDRPSGVDAYLVDEFAADALAVLDATGTEHAVLVASSCGSLWGTIVAADHPERVHGIVHIGPAVGLAPGHPERQVYPLRRRARDDGRVGEVQPPLLAARLPRLPRVLLRPGFTEPHSTKQIEDCVGWGLEIDPETLAHTHWATRCVGRAVLETCVRVRCPVLVIHGDLTGSGRTRRARLWPRRPAGRS